MTSKQKLSEIKYLIRLAEDKATFVWGTTPQTPLKSSVDLRELLSLLKKLNTLVEKGKAFVQNLESYNRSLAYACVRPTLERGETAHGLREPVPGMTSRGARHWVSAFRELWWR